ncbi:MAG: hypothetical protein HYR95_00325 [Candidatus Colwellbacteria bacterium]|nr:hypothetical protein [Candidatus Colwellbacteria bacterium]MBI3274083.1 hypothetical protein [Candidatus Colwellbacteria bacterium]
MTELPADLQSLIESYKTWKQELNIGNLAEVITVDEVAARVASFYEKIRSVVDWKEEHLLRKTVIERILKRRTLLKRGLLVGVAGREHIFNFIAELIRGGHFPNGRIPSVKVDEIQTILNKYIFLIEKSLFQRRARKIENWLLQVASYEIEIALDPHIREVNLIEYMAQDFINKLELREENKGLISEDERKLQIYLGVHRALFKMDDPVLTYHLLERLYPDWRAPSNESIQSISSDIIGIQAVIGKVLKHPLSESFYRIAEQYDTLYLILSDVISEDPENFTKIVSGGSLEEKIDLAYKSRLAKLKGKVGRAALYSTISIFVTKVLFVLALEIPVDRYFHGSLNYTAIALSIVAPPLLMMILLLSVKLTSAPNLQDVKHGVLKLMDANNRQTYYLAIPRKKRLAQVLFLDVFYFLSFLFSFWLLSWMLYRAHFGPFSIVVFAMFISLVSFAGTKIQSRGRELMVGEVKTGFISSLIDFLFLPIVQVGKWLSNQLIRYNAIVFLFNFLIEAPLQIFVEFLEQWRAFLKEKKERIH